MKRAVRVLPLVILLIAGVVLLSREQDDLKAPPGSVTPSTPDATPSVKVEHTLITAELVAPRELSRTAEAPAARTPLRRPPVALASSLPTREKPSSLASKTRRILVGDGRYKPQPFPRINNN